VTPADGRTAAADIVDGGTRCGRADPRWPLPRAWLGIGGETVPLARRVVRHFGFPRDSGMRVGVIEPRSPAVTAGFARGDVVISVGGAPTRDVDDLLRLLNGDAVGRRIEFRVLRRETRHTLAVVPREKASGARQR
jgi:S1-C subfamily serine protease